MDKAAKKRRSHRRIRIYVMGVPILTIILLACLIAYVPEPSRVIIIGLDGIDWDILNPLMDAGRLPNIKRIVDGGATGKLETYEPSISAAIWTTIATGVTRKVHGIKDFVIRDAGDLPYNSGMRKVPAMWNVASHYNRHVGIVGHWISWPAEKINGEMVSNFLNYGPKEAPELYYKGERHKVVDVADKTYPNELLQEIEPMIITLDDITHADLDRFFDIDDWNDPALYDKHLGVALNLLIPFYHAADTTHFDVFDHLRRTKKPYDLLYVYVQSTDVASHRFWHFRDTTYLDETMKYWGYDLRNRDKYVKCFSDTINRFYEWADERIGPVLDEMGPRDTLVIVSDHGFGPYYTECGYSTEVEGHTFSGSHAHFGVIMMYGANIKKGYRLKGPPPKVTDVLPTVLSLMKVPVAQWMQGFPITQAFTDRFDKTYDPVWVREYGIEDNFGKQNPSSPFDEDFVKRMKSLGYLQ